jgi:hypothetical protein
VAEAADGDQLEGEQGEDVAEGGDVRGGGVGGRADQAGEIEGEQFGDGEEEASGLGSELARELVEVDLCGRGQGLQGGAPASCMGALSRPSIPRSSKCATTT